MWIFELQVVLLLEVLSDCALHGLAVLKLQGEPGGKWENRREARERAQRWQHNINEAPRLPSPALTFGGWRVDV